jgi:hypothetical protein
MNTVSETGVVHPAMLHFFPEEGAFAPPLHLRPLFQVDKVQILRLENDGEKKYYLWEAHANQDAVWRGLHYPPSAFAIIDSVPLETKIGDLVPGLGFLSLQVKYNGNNHKGYADIYVDPLHRGQETVQRAACEALELVFSDSKRPVQEIYLKNFGKYVGEKLSQELGCTPKMQPMALKQLLKLVLKLSGREETVVLTRGAWEAAKLEAKVRLGVG